MKVFSIFLVTGFCLTTNIFPQGGWSTHIITTDADDARSVYAVDLDGDGDIDVLSASFFDSKIAWYENLGGGNFGPQIIINAEATSASSVYAEDIDGDGDMDVLASGVSEGFEGITWYENDGNETFTAHPVFTIVATNVNAYVYAEDLNNDGNMDLMYCAFSFVRWLENDGNEIFTSRKIFTSNSITASSIYAEDIDGDGFIDVLSAFEGENTARWHMNDGNENFILRFITATAIGVLSVYAEDVNSDGHMDVLTASSGDDKIAWYENNGNEVFTLHPITTDANFASSVYAVDMDIDGDIDVLSASSFDDKIAWYENDGSENFTTHIITTSADFARSVYAADIDGDGDMDVLSASRFDDKIAWYKNPLISTRVEAISNDIPVEFVLSQNYPNPFNPSTTIRFSVPEESYVSIVVLNPLGEEVTKLLNENITAGNYEVEFDATGLPSGIYFYKLQAVPSTGSGQGFVETKKMVVLK